MSVSESTAALVVLLNLCSCKLTPSIMYVMYETEYGPNNKSHLL